MLTMLGKMSRLNVGPAKHITSTSHVVSGRLRVTEHFFQVPEDYSKPDGTQMCVFGRSVRKNEIPIVPNTDKDQDQLPWMCYLNGGPGMSCPPPQQWNFTWSILEKGYQLLFLDQRGTGLSTHITPSTLRMRGSDERQAKYLKLHRADNIVRDSEAIRQLLTANYPEAKKKWSIIGQSFGGFCSMNYLSFYPEGLRESFIFGGLQPLVKNPDEVYRRLYKKVIQRNEAYYAKYPEDEGRVKTIMDYLKRNGDGQISLPSGGKLTRQRFRQMGIGLGFHGGLDRVHNTVLQASVDIELYDHLTHSTLSAIERTTHFDDALIYAILHEPIYCEGEAPNWSADRLMQEYPIFDLDRDGPVYFTGEMIYPSMFEDYSELRKVKDVANLIAADSDWPALFDEEQLAKNEVPVYAASYVEDMYVDFDLSMETARKIKNCKTFTTNVMFHDAIRSKMDAVFRQAFALREDVID